MAKADDLAPILRFPKTKQLRKSSKHDAHGTKGDWKKYQMNEKI